MSAKTTAEQAERALRKLASKERSVILSSFFKTGPGQYGEGDKFIGVNIPDVRKIGAEFRNLDEAQIQKLLYSPIHEIRLLALVILGLQFQNSGEQSRKRIVDFYLKHRKQINNWDLVDCSAGKILGAYLMKRDKSILFKFAESDHLWTRRIAIVSTYYFIRNNHFEETLALCELLLNDKQDLMHKACGWMLREIGKQNEKVLVEFLKKNAPKMPRTMLRYAIERFPEKTRREWLMSSKPVKKVLAAAACAILLTLQGCASLSGGASYSAIRTPVQAPAGIAVDLDKNIFITSTDNGGSVLKMTPQEKVTVLAQNLGKLGGLLLDPEQRLYVSVEEDKGDVFLLDQNGRIDKIVPELQEPEGLALSPQGTLYISEDAAHGRVIKFSEGSTSILIDGLDRAENLALDPDGLLYVTETIPGQITRVLPNGAHETFVTGITKADGLCYCPAYNGFFAAEDLMQGRIVFTDLTGSSAITIARNLRFPQGLVCDDEGNLLAAERGKNRILLFRQRELSAELHKHQKVTPG